MDAFTEKTSSIIQPYIDLFHTAAARKAGGSSLLMELATEYDVVVLGTGLIESILAAYVNSGFLYLF